MRQAYDYWQDQPGSYRISSAGEPSLCLSGPHRRFNGQCRRASRGQNAEEEAPSVRQLWPLDAASLNSRAEGRRDGGKRRRHTTQHKVETLPTAAAAASAHHPTLYYTSTEAAGRSARAAALGGGGPTTTNVAATHLATVIALNRGVLRSNRPLDRSCVAVDLGCTHDTA